MSGLGDRYPKCAPNPPHFRARTPPGQRTEPAGTSGLRRSLSRWVGRRPPTNRDSSPHHTEDLGGLSLYGTAFVSSLGRPYGHRTLKIGIFLSLQTAANDGR